jgi:hypothetical protein
VLFSWRAGDDEMVRQTLASLPAGVATAHTELRAITFDFTGLTSDEINECLRIMSASGVISGSPPSEEAVIRLDPNRLRSTPSWAAYDQEDGSWYAHCEQCGWSFEVPDEPTLDSRQAEHDRRVHGITPTG